MLVPDQNQEPEQTKQEEGSSVVGADDESMAPPGERQRPPNEAAPPVKIKIKARSSATPGSAGTSTPTSVRGDSVLELDTASRLLKPPAPVLELGPRVEPEIFVLETGDAGLKKKASSQTSKSEDGSLERKMEDARIDGERSGSEKPDTEARSSRKRPPSGSLSGPPSTGGGLDPSDAAEANGGMGPPSTIATTTDAEHLAKKRKKGEDDVTGKLNWATMEKVNGYALALTRSDSPNGLERQPHEDFRGAGGRTIYSARKPD